MGLLDDALVNAARCVHDLEAQAERYRNLHTSVTSLDSTVISDNCSVSLNLFGVQLDNVTLEQLGVDVNNCDWLRAAFAESLKTSAVSMRDLWSELQKISEEASTHITANLPKSE